MGTPLEVVGFHETIFKFFGTFEIKSESAFAKSLMKVHTIFYQIVFTDLGFILFSLSIVESPSSKQTLQILFVVFAYLNAAFKAFTFYFKRNELQNMWTKMEDKEYTAKDHVENE